MQNAAAGDDDDVGGGTVPDDGAAIPVNSAYSAVPSSDPLSSVASYRSAKNTPVAVRVAKGDDATTTATSNGEYRVYPVRWLMLFLYALNQIVNSILWITFAPIQPNASAYYGVNSTAINMLSIIFMILYFPASIAASHVFAKYGLKTGVRTRTAFSIPTSTCLPPFVNSLVRGCDKTKTNLHR